MPVNIEIRTFPVSNGRRFDGFDTLPFAHLSNRWVVPMWKYRLIKLFLGE